MYQYQIAFSCLCKVHVCPFSILIALYSIDISFDNELYFHFFFAEKWNIQFPKVIRREGAKYLVQELKETKFFSGKYYR